MSDDELKDLEIKDLKDNAQLNAIIAGSKAKRLSIDLNGVEIFIKASIKKGLRERMMRIAKMWKEGEVEEESDELYEITAALCLEDPYKDAIVWKYIDQETGEVPNVLKMITERIVGVEDTAKRFR